MSSLTSLDLSHNKIKYLPGSLFATVGITDPYFTDGNRYYFYSFDLNLSNNDLCTLDPDLFGDHLRFWHLTFESNKISCLPPYVFDKIETTEIVLSNNKITGISPEILAVSVSQDVWDYYTGGYVGPCFETFGVSVHLDVNRITYIPADLLIYVTNGVVDLLDLSYNLISFIHPNAFSNKEPEKLDLSHNQLICLPEGVFINFDSNLHHDLKLHSNQLTTVHPNAFFGNPWIDPPVFDYDSYCGPHLYIDLGSLNCSTMCWLKNADAGIYISSCLDGIDWATWDGLDSNGQCVFPPAPVCPLPSTIPVAPIQCPTECPGK